MALVDVELEWGLTQAYHSYDSTSSPGVLRGTMKQLTPFASPSFPAVLAKMKQCVAVCMPVCHFFHPSILQPSTPSFVSGLALVAICVASLPCPGSVRPNVILTSPLKRPHINSSFCFSFPKCCTMTTSGKLPTILCSFCRSLNKPRPFAARCSRMTAIHKLLPRPSALFCPPYCFGRESR